MLINAQLGFSMYILYVYGNLNFDLSLFWWCDFFLDQMCNLDSNNNSQFSHCKTERLIRGQSFILLP